MTERLTEREYQVLIPVARGKANKEIARELHITVKTVEYHMTNILGKLGAANRTEAVVKALEQGLLDRADLWGIATQGIAKPREIPRQELGFPLGTRCRFSGTLRLDSVSMTSGL